MVAQQPQEERQRLPPLGSGCEGARHLPKNIYVKLVKDAVVALSDAMARAKDCWRGYSQPGIQLVELRLPWLSSLHIMRISDAEALTERVNGCAASEGLIEEGKARAEMRVINLRPRCSCACLTSAVCFVAAATAAESVADISSVGKVRRHGHGAVIGHGQAAKKRG